MVCGGIDVAKFLAMRRPHPLPFLAALLLLAPPAPADDQADAARAVYDAHADSVVVARYTYDSPGQRAELDSLGLVVDDRGLIMVPLEFVNTAYPDEYLTRFQIVVPADADEDRPEREYDAVFAGRDERSGVAFLRYDDGSASTRPATRPADADDLPPPTWTPIEFAPGGPPEVGEVVYSLGRMPEDFGYTPYVTQSRVAAPVRGPLPLRFTAGAGLTAPGSVVFDAQGRAVGYVPEQGSVSPVRTFLNTPQAAIQAVSVAPPRLFVPADFLRISLENPPSPDSPVAIPDLGLRQLSGLSKDLREFFELGETPAVQVGEVIADSAAAGAGVEAGDVIVSLNDEDLERGDAPEELPDILDRTVSRLGVGGTVTLGLLNAAGDRRSVDVDLRERPTQASSVPREFFDDLGFAAREAVFDDRYARKLDSDAAGVVIEFVRENSAAAGARLGPGDFVRRINQTPVADLGQFASALREFREASPREAVVLEVLRRGDTEVIRVEPPR